MNEKYRLPYIIVFTLILVCQAQAVEFSHHLIEMDFEYIIAANFIDFDLDNDLDIFITAADGSGYGVPFPECELYYLENNGSGNFESHSIITYDDGDWWIRNIDVVDFDGDGDLDLLLTGGEGEEGWNSLTLLLNTGRELEFSHYTISTEENAIMPWQIKAHDIDSNGVMDIIAAFYGVDPLGRQGVEWGALFAYIQTDSLDFQAVEMDDWGVNGWTNLEILDIDGDGTPEILADEIGLHAHMDLRFYRHFWRWNGEGFDREEQPVSDLLTHWSDFNRDGMLDYVTVRDSLPPTDSLQVRLFLQTEPFEFEQISLFTYFRIYYDLAVGDLDLDGNPEILVTGVLWDREDAQTYLLLNCVEEEDSIRILPNADFSCWSRFFIHDINCDGYADIFRAFHNWREDKRYLEWYENTTQGVNDETPGNPAKFALYAAYPNPFNSQFNVEYRTEAPELVSLRLMDVGGRLIHEMQRNETSGTHIVNINANSLSSGVYFLQVSTAGSRAVRKVQLVR